MKYKIGDKIVYTGTGWVMYEILDIVGCKYFVKPILKYLDGTPFENELFSFSVLDDDPTFRRFDFMKEIIGGE